MAVTKPGEYRNLCDVFRQIVRCEGAAALYTGFTPTMFGVVLYAGTSFFTYESFKAVWYAQRKHLDNPEPNPLQRWISVKDLIVTHMTITV